MKKPTSLESRVECWVQEGLLDSAAAQRILTFEATRSRQTTLRWPVLLAVGFGGILIAAGVTLFVAAHWDELSPTARFTLVVAMVAVFHTGGALAADRFPALSTTLHAVGTAVLGAGIFLSAQIFNLQENWPTGILLWAIGAAAAFLLLRHWTQAGFVAVLVPVWLISQWTYVMDERLLVSARVPAFGALLLALCYLSARMGDQEDPVRRTLVWIGGIALFPAAITAVLIARESGIASGFRPQLQVTPMMQLTGWTVALLVPLAVAWLLRGSNVWANLVCAGWAFAVVEVAGIRGSPDRFSAAALLYLLCGLGAVGLVSWGLHEKRKERLNLGIAGFALTVLFFYFDNFMDKLGRSASLLTLGVLCLAGGWALERTRKRLLARMETA